MKESTILEMKNKVDAVVRVTQHLINEITQIKDLSIGTLETIKKMPGYEKALEQLKNEVTKKDEHKEKVEVPTTKDS